jgi:hypothetical protein
MIRLTPSQITVDAAAAEGLPSRSISGVAVTYDETATVSDGTTGTVFAGVVASHGARPKTLYATRQQSNCRQSS